MTMAYSAQALVEQADATSGGTIALTGLTIGRGLTVTFFLHSAGSTPSALAATFNGTDVLTVIDSPSYNSTSSWAIQMAYFPAVTAASGNLVYTFSGTDNPNEISYAIVKEIYDTVAGGIDVDASGSGTGSSTDPTFNIATTASSNLIIGGLSSNAALTVGSGYTDNGSIAWYIGEWSQYQIYSSSGTKTFNFTGLTSQWAGAATAFKAAAAGGPSVAQTWPAMVGATNNAVMIGRRFI